MYKYMAIIFISLSIFCAVLGCASGNSTSETDESQSLAPAQTDPSDSATDTIREYGLLKHVEDSSYPFFTLTVDFPERQFEESFVFNMEEVVGWDAAMLSEAVGKYISFDYYSEVINALFDLRYGGQSILNPDGVTDANAKRLKGVLSGAEEVTIGDLPGMLFISTEEEYFETFDFYITPEIVALNGKVVEAHYDQRTRNMIVSMEVKD